VQCVLIVLSGDPRVGTSCVGSGARLRIVYRTKTPNLSQKEVAGQHIVGAGGYCVSRSLIVALAALSTLFLPVEKAEAQTSTPTPTPTVTSTVSATPTRTTTPSSQGSIIGLVFDDDNRNGRLDGREDGVNDVQLTLERLDVSDKSRSTRTNSDGKYRFDGLASGDYLLTLKVPSDAVSTTSTRVNLFVGTSQAVVQDFGLDSSGSNDNDTDNEDDGFIVDSNGRIIATSSNDNGSRRIRLRATATLVPTLTPWPTITPTRTPTPTPSILSRLQQIVSLSDNQFVSYTIRGHTDDNGVRADFEGDGEVLEAKDMSMHLGFNGQELEIIISGQSSYERETADEFWQKTDMRKLRERHGVLSPLDVLALPLLADQTIDVRRLGYEQVDGELLQRYEIAVRRPAPPTLTTGTATQQRPALTTSTGLEVLEGRVNLWVSEPEGRIQKAHLTLGVPSVIREHTGRLDPARMDVWLTFADHNTAFTIREPGPEVLARATEGPVRVAQVPVVQPAPAPAPGRAGPQPATGASRELTPGPGSGTRTPEPLRDGEIAASSGRELPERAVAADRAVLALASAAGPRAGSEVDEERVLLGVPWRTRNESSGPIPATDGSASLGMILEAYGVTVKSADLQALGERYQESLQPGDALRIDTLTRLAERGALRTVGSGVEWSAAVARDYLRRGYPVMALVKPGLLFDPPLDGATEPDRYIVLVGFDGDHLLYQDPSSEGGERSVPPLVLDRAWTAALPPRQGQAFGFGSNLTSLMAPPGQASAAATRAPQTTRLAATAAPATAVAVVVTPPATESTTAGGFGLQPVLVLFLVAVAGGVGFVVSRLIR
jgi:hypothetical protein